MCAMSMFRRLLLPSILTAVLALAASLALAGPGDRARPLYDALGMPVLLEILLEEGRGYGAELEEDLFPGRGRAEWARAVAAIYAPERMERTILAQLDSELTDQELAEIGGYFGSEAGQKIIALEIAARRAMLDEAVEEAATEGWLALESEDGARWRLLTEFAEVNDLIETNVAGAMTSNYAFYRGLMQGEAFAFELTEEQILTDVWNQEAEIRENTRDWVFSFTSLAYQPLSDDELADYVAFSRTPEGKALNAALFAAFNVLFAEISLELGLGAAHYLSGQDI